MASQEFNDFHEEALDEAVAFMGDTFTYKGADYQAVISEVEFTGELIEGGFMEGIATVILVPLTQLSTVPKKHDVVKVGSKTLKVEKVKTDAVSIEITCVTPHK